MTAAVYLGKIWFEKYAVNENIAFIFPQGIVQEAPAIIFSTWTRAGDGVEKKPAFIDVKYKLFTIGNEWIIKGDGAHYYFKGSLGTDSLTLDMFNKSDEHCVRLNPDRVH